jgi:hypothetical protein
MRRRRLFVLPLLGIAQADAFSDRLSNLMIHSAAVKLCINPFPRV